MPYLSEYPKREVVESVAGDVTLAAGTTLALVNTSAARAVDLPSAAALSGKRLTIIDITGSAGLNNITITTQGAETIDGLASIAIIDGYGSLCLISDGSNWFTMSD